MKPRHTYFLTASLLLAVVALACGKNSSPVSDADNEEIAFTEEVLISKPSDRDACAPVITTATDAMDFMRRSPDSDHYRHGILPQMVSDEFDYARRLLCNTHDGFVVVDKQRMAVIKFNRFGEAQATFKMACAKNYGTKHKRSDSRTPEGFFSVKRIHNSESWHYVDDNGVESQKTGEYGPRFIRLNIPGTTQIGIHGTCAPWSLGGRRSHGCIRIHNDNIMKLVEMVDSGMPVIVSPGLKDMAVNEEEGYEIPSISTIPGSPRPRLMASRTDREPEGDFATSREIASPEGLMSSL